MNVIKDTGARAVLPPFGEEHEALRETVRRFVSKEIAPHVDEWEAAREFPLELFRRCGELGFLGLKFPERYGGQGGTHLHDAVWVEELARSGGSGGVAAGLNAHASIAMPPIFNFGTDEQRQRWLVPGIAGEKVGALGITEPGAGSDVAGISTFAKRVDGGYVVNGAKTFITNGVRADFLVCACKTTEEGGHEGISFLVLEREMPGYQVARKLEKMGWHSSDTGELSFTDVQAPTENLLGEENEGFRLIMAAGSDVAGISTFAKRVDGGYVVNGAKTFITNGVRADFLVCACKTTEEGGHEGISFLVLEREMPGYQVARKLEKMGWHSSDTGELSFTDVQAPTENLLGEENEGFRLIMANFAWERLLMAIGAVGAMQRLIEITVSYALDRAAFGRPIGKFQAIRHQLAEMATRAEAARALTYNALRLFHEGQDCIRDVTMAKLVTQRSVLEIADQSLQIHGGYGYMKEYGIERAVRDARLGTIGGGTDEIMKEILGRQMGL